MSSFCSGLLQLSSLSYPFNPLWLSEDREIYVADSPATFTVTVPQLSANVNNSGGSGVNNHNYNVSLYDSLSNLSAANERKESPRVFDTAGQTESALLSNKSTILAGLARLTSCALLFQCEISCSTDQTGLDRGTGVGRQCPNQLTASATTTANVIFRIPYSTMLDISVLKSGDKRNSVSIDSSQITELKLTEVKNEYRLLTPQLVHSFFCQTDSATGQDRGLSSRQQSLSFIPKLHSSPAHKDPSVEQLQWNDSSPSGRSDVSAPMGTPGTISGSSTSCHKGVDGRQVRPIHSTVRFSNGSIWSSSEMCALLTSLTSTLPSKQLLAPPSNQLSSPSFQNNKEDQRKNKNNNSGSNPPEKNTLLLSPTGLSSTSKSRESVVSNPKDVSTIILEMKNQPSLLRFALDVSARRHLSICKTLPSSVRDRIPEPALVGRVLPLTTHLGYFYFLPESFLFFPLPPVSPMRKSLILEPVGGRGSFGSGDNPSCRRQGADSVMPVSVKYSQCILAFKRLVGLSVAGIEIFYFRPKFKHSGRVSGEDGLVPSQGTVSTSGLKCEVGQLYLYFGALGWRTRNGEAQLHKLFEELEKRNPGIFSPQKDRTMLTHMRNLWQKGIISNFHYLDFLNCMAGRSVQTLSAYPVYPWIVSNWAVTDSARLTTTSLLLDQNQRKDKDGNINQDKDKDKDNQSVETGSETEKKARQAHHKEFESHLVLNTHWKLPGAFRDLSKPLGALNYERLEVLVKRLAHLPSTDQFLYGSHYSTPAFVAFWKIRNEPELQLKLHNGRFDAISRVFHSVERSWDGALKGQTSFMELTSDFFRNDPSFLTLPLGPLNSSDGLIQKVVLPDGCIPPSFLSTIMNKNSGYEYLQDNGTIKRKNTAEDEALWFLFVHRLLLESSIVSRRLNSWIDLIFGCKQKGKPAHDALNVFHRITYISSSLPEVTSTLLPPQTSLPVSTTSSRRGKDPPKPETDKDKDKDNQTTNSGPVLTEFEKNHGSALRAQMAEFGQTPFQLFDSPHPARHQLAEILRFKSKSDIEVELQSLKSTSGLSSRQIGDLSYLSISTLTELYKCFLNGETYLGNRKSNSPSDAVNMGSDSWLAALLSLEPGLLPKLKTDRETSQFTSSLWKQPVDSFPTNPDLPAAWRAAMPRFYSKKAVGQDLGKIKTAERAKASEVEKQDIDVVEWAGIETAGQLTIVKSFGICDRDMDVVSDEFITKMVTNKSNNNNFDDINISSQQLGSLCPRGLISPFEFSTPKNSLYDISRNNKQLIITSVGCFMNSIAVVVQNCPLVPIYPLYRLLENYNPQTQQTRKDSSAVAQEQQHLTYLSLSTVPPGLSSICSEALKQDERQMETNSSTPGSSRPWIQKRSEKIICPSHLLNLNNISSASNIGYPTVLKFMPKSQDVLVGTSTGWLVVFCQLLQLCGGHSSPSKLGKETSSCPDFCGPRRHKLFDLSAKQHAKGITCMEFCGGTILTGGEDNSVCVWTLEEEADEEGTSSSSSAPRLVHKDTLDCHEAHISAILGINDDIFITGDVDGFVAIHDLNSLESFSLTALKPFRQLSGLFSVQQICASACNQKWVHFVFQGLPKSPRDLIVLDVEFSVELNRLINGELCSIAQSTKLTAVRVMPWPESDISEKIKEVLSSSSCRKGSSKSSATPSVENVGTANNDVVRPLIPFSYLASLDINKVNGLLLDGSRNCLLSVSCVKYQSLLLNVSLSTDSKQPQGSKTTDSQPSIVLKWQFGSQSSEDKDVLSSCVLGCFPGPLGLGSTFARPFYHPEHLSYQSFEMNATTSQMASGDELDAFPFVVHLSQNPNGQPKVHIVV